MNASTSDYSSGCESGWTTYLDQNSNWTTDPYSRGFYDERGAAVYVNEVEEDDEDLSMVSDASSGPPHYENSQYYCYASAISEDKTKKSKPRKEAKQKQKQKKSLCLDDTASSSIFHFSQDNVPFSDDRNSAGNVYSAAHCEDASVTKKRLSFFKSSKSGNLFGRKKQ